MALGCLTLATHTWGKCPADLFIAHSAVAQQLLLEKVPDPQVKGFGWTTTAFARGGSAHCPSSSTGPSPHSHLLVLPPQVPDPLVPSLCQAHLQ